MEQSPRFRLPTVESERLTTLWQVARDGNPLRQHAHVSPWLGKLSPLNARSLDSLASLMLSVLPPLKGPTLIIGLAESSLLLASVLYAHWPGDAHLILSTRYPENDPQHLVFREPHSHGPQHFLPRPPHSTYEQIIIVEDEITTGVTAQNLILTLGDFSDQFHLLSLQDMRSPIQRRSQAMALAGQGITLWQYELADFENDQEADRIGMTPFKRRINHHSESVLNQVMWETLSREMHALKPDFLYVIGEAIAPAFLYWQSQPIIQRPHLHHVTQSPWQVDQMIIADRLDITCPTHAKRYFAYNRRHHACKKALVIADRHSATIAEQFRWILEQEETEAEICLLSRS